RSALTRKGVIRMGMRKDTAPSGQTSLRAPSAIADAPLAPRSVAGIHERILRLLGMTQRPLRSGELENALGLVAGEARSACHWLTENGYITSTVRLGRAAAHWARTFWSLADKGRSSPDRAQRAQRPMAEHTCARLVDAGGLARANQKRMPPESGVWI